MNPNLILTHLLLLLPQEHLSEPEQSALIAKDRGWKAEVALADGSRADLISEQYAVEVEWAPKWKEAPAQATLYALLADKKPLVILLTKGDSAEKLHILRCKLVCEKLGIKLETIKARN